MVEIKASIKFSKKFWKPSEINWKRKRESCLKEQVNHWIFRKQRKIPMFFLRTLDKIIKSYRSISRNF